MKKSILTLISFSFLFITNAQVVTFLSLGSATVERDAKGNFADVKIWVVKQRHINFDMTQNKLQFLSEGLLDTDTFSLNKEISILNKITSPNIFDEQTRVYAGLDQEGRKCIVRFKVSKDGFIIVQDGELQIEYIDHAEIYSLRKSKRSFLNKG